MLVFTYCSTRVKNPFYETKIIRWTCAIVSFCINIVFLFWLWRQSRKRASKRSNKGSDGNLGDHLESVSEHLTVVRRIGENLSVAERSLERRMAIVQAKENELDAMAAGAEAVQIDCGPVRFNFYASFLLDQFTF